MFDEKEAICTECNKKCTVVTVDEGVGQYEYGSVVGYHHDYIDVSDCCEAETIQK